MSNKNRYDQIHRFSIIYLSNEGRTLRGSKSHNDVANYVAKFGQEKIPRFANDMVQIFGPDIKVSYKNDIPRISAELQQIITDENCPASESWYKLSDTMKLQICCKDEQGVKQTFKKMLG